MRHGLRLPVLGQLGRRLDLVCHMPGMLQPAVVKVGDAEFASCAKKQALTQLGFQRGQAARHRRLGQPQPVAGSAETALVDHAAKSSRSFGSIWAFSRTDKGPIGLLAGKKLYVGLARGGLHRNTPADTQVPYLKMALGFLGMTDVQFVYAEASGHGAAGREEGAGVGRGTD